MPPRGKFKPSRGGGKHFSRDVQLRDKDGNPMSLFGEHDGPENNDEEESSSEEEGSGSGSGSGSEEEEEGKGAEAGPSMTREERRAAVKAKKQAAIARRKQMATQPGDLPPSDDEDNAGEGRSEDAGGAGGGDVPANPNHTAKSREQLEKPDENASKPKKDLSQLSRREREALEAQQERERYMKLHAEGKTDEARADLARLAVIREQREAERVRKQAEKEEREAAAKEKAAARDALLNKKGPKKGGKKK